MKALETHMCIYVCMFNLLTILPNFIMLPYLKQGPFYSCRLAWHWIYQQIYKPFSRGIQNRFSTSTCILTLFCFLKCISGIDGKEEWKLILHILLYCQFCISSIFESVEELSFASFLCLQVFVFLTAEYVTPKHALNQVWFL